MALAPGPAAHCREGAAGVTPARTSPRATNSITVKCNTGSFKAGDKVYLFVVDSNDIASDASEELEVGQDTGSSSTRPTNLQVVE